MYVGELSIMPSLTNRDVYHGSRTDLVQVALLLPTGGTRGNNRSQI